MLMPKEGIDSGLLAPCGMNCMVCYRHLVRRKPCGGCRENGEGKPGHCRDCRIKACVLAKGLGFCYECGAFPCKPLKNLDRSYRVRYGASLVENGLAVKDAGPEAVLKRQKAQFACPACGGVISLHDAVCSECGASCGASCGAKSGPPEG